MYNFRDLNYVDSPEEDDLPSESIVFNGINIDKTIPEFRTLQVTGRELMGQTLDTLKVGQQDGERIQGHSIPPREIVVKYEVNAPTPQRFREIYYQLNSILAGVNNKIYFADDPEKYFIGTFEDASVPDGGRLSVVSDFTILCNDPHAYSANEDEFDLNSSAERYTAQNDFNGKTMGDITKVPHTIYSGYEPITVAMQPPSYYTQEITTDQYSKLASINGECATVVAKAKRTTSITQTIFPLATDSPKTGALDYFRLNGDNIEIGGWFAWEQYATHPYNYIIITDADWNNEYGRVKVNLTDRPDVHNAYPNYPNGGRSGFYGSIPYKKGMGNKNLRIHFRYSDSENGEGDWCNCSFIASSQDYWQQSAPHLLVKFDLVKAYEQFQPGYWEKYKINGRQQQLEWLKKYIISARFGAVISGSGASGNNARMQVWDQNDSWVGNADTASPTPSLVTISYATPTELFNYVSADGYLYFNIFPQYDVSGDTVDSVINLDYFSAQIVTDAPEAEAMNIVNDGPLPVAARFEVTNHGDNGFLGIISNDRSVLIGNPNEIDGGKVEKSETLFTTDKTATDLSQFKINAGVSGADEDIRQVGSIYIGSNRSKWALMCYQPDSGYHFGEATSGTDRGWHGPSVHRDMGEDSEGNTGSDNFTCETRIGFESQIADAGLVNIVLNAAAGERLVTVQIVTGNNANATLLVRNSDNQNVYYDNSPRWNTFVGTIKIQRFGNTWTVNVQDTESGSGARQTITFDQTASGAKKVTGWTWQICQWSNIQQVPNMVLFDFWFRKENVDEYVNVPNTFEDGDLISVGGNENEVETRVNGSLNLALQNIASKSIMVYPGNNIISFLYSNYASSPDVKAYIRKKYL
ncbi:distal tail protein Dit [Lactobacillus acetotolerans]|uniref:distal tail protein Dit n=1 Tax=Lactobacillus acetotolerans TaxID=1600 RepID=UPI002FDAE069